jgi:tetratricopeptide (TPR) repeat protein
MLSLVLVIAVLAAAPGGEQSKQPPTDELAVPAGPIEAQNLYRKGRLALKDQRFGEALTHYQQLIKQYSGGDQKHFYYPAGAEAHAAIGDCLLGLKKVREAIDAYTRTENMYPAGSRSQRVRMKLGDCYMELGDYERALVLYKEFRKDWAAVYSRKPMPPEIDGKILNAKRMLEEQRKKGQPTRVSRCRRSCNC